MTTKEMIIALISGAVGSVAIFAILYGLLLIGYGLGY
jgi:hypothetical protein